MEPAEQPSEHFPFLRLPCLVRDQIYLLSVGSWARTPVCIGSPGQAVTFGLVYVCHQVYHESIKIFYARNTFTFHLPALTAMRLREMVQFSQVDGSQEEYDAINKSLGKVRLWQFRLSCVFQSEEMNMTRHPLIFPAWQAPGKNFLPVLEQVLNWIQSRHRHSVVLLNVDFGRRLDWAELHRSDAYENAASHIGQFLQRRRNPRPHLEIVSVKSYEAEKLAEHLEDYSFIVCSDLNGCVLHAALIISNVK